MKTLQELRQLVADLAAKGREARTRINEIHGMAEADLTDDIRAESDTLVADADKIAEELETARADLEFAEAKLRHDRAFAAPAAGSTIVLDMNPETTHGFKALGEFASAVRAASSQGGHVDERLINRGLSPEAAPTNVHREAGDEGYMVPPAMAAGIWDVVDGDTDTLVNEVDDEPTERNAVTHMRDETTPYGSTGVEARWRSEASKMTPSEMEEKESLVKLNELYAFVNASEELLEDTPRLESRLTKKAGEAIVWKANEGIYNGSGVGQPLGFRNSAAMVTVAKESGQAADTVVAMNIAKMYARMMASGMARAQWRVNQDVLPQLMTMTINDNLIWTPPASGFTNAPGGVLLGRPVRFTEHAETVGDAGDVMFVDPKGYYSPRKRNGVKFDESIHLFFDYNVKSFRWTFRMGGQPHLSKPVSPNKGTATRSHFIQLAARG